MLHIFDDAKTLNYHGFGYHYHQYILLHDNISEIFHTYMNNKITFLIKAYLLIPDLLLLNEIQW